MRYHRELKKTATRAMNHIGHFFFSLDIDCLHWLYWQFLTWLGWGRSTMSNYITDWWAEGRTNQPTNQEDQRQPTNSKRGNSNYENHIRKFNHFSVKTDYEQIKEKPINQSWKMLTLLSKICILTCQVLKQYHNQMNLQVAWWIFSDFCSSAIR